ncbi:MAG: cyclic lactone autoinducer peptide [Bacilli bacterium]|nr:cyclic lactone autoinducer peptide [Bacilli bacterium]
MGIIASILSTLGTLAAAIGSQACMVVIVDEPECPKSLIK